MLVAKGRERRPRLKGRGGKMQSHYVGQVGGGKEGRTP